MAIPESHKLRHGELKHSLKQAVRGLLPDDLIDRKKQGFGVPVHEWLFDRLGPAIRSDVLWLTEQTDLFDRRAVTAYLDERADTNVWTLYNLALWWRRYLA